MMVEAPWTDFKNHFRHFQSMKVDIFRFMAASWDGGGIVSSYRYMGERITAHLLIDESAAP